MPPSNPATRFQAAAISFSLINLVSRPLYHHWPLLAYLSPRASHFFRFIPFFLFFLSRYRFFFFFFFIPSDQLDLSRISGKITLIHSIEAFTIEEEIEFRIRFSGLFFFIIPFYSSSGGAKGWIMHSRDRITSSTNDPPPPATIHPSIQKENSFSKQWNFVSIPGLSRYRCFAGNSVYVASVKRRIYICIYVCIILDTFRWCFNFPINACLNRISRFGKFIFHAITRRSGILSVFHVRLFPI